MAGALKEEERAQRVYATLQAACCPLVEGLDLKEAASMLELLCSESPHRTAILTWTCTSISPSLNKKLSSLRSTEADALTRELAVFGQELLLCRADDLDLIKGSAGPQRQLSFLEQLLTLVPGPTGRKAKASGELVRELFSAESLPYLADIITPTLNPWPADIRALLPKTSREGQRSERQSSLLSRSGLKETDDVTALLQTTKTTLEQLQSECEFLRGETQSASVFSACALRVALSDLAQLMATFSCLYDTDFRSYCDTAPPSGRPGTHTFATVHQQLQACNTELELLQQVTEASRCVTETVEQLHTKPCCWSRGEKRTLPFQLEELTSRYRSFVSLHQASTSSLCISTNSRSTIEESQ